ncbi:MAG: ParA family protein [Betaproteobacteria bacterium]|nr:ParA family protein [Betaproteobacteria bacterium]
MKTLLVTVSKGGVGKSMLTCQLARHARACGLRVLVVDFDDQVNASKALERRFADTDVVATRLGLTATELLLRYNQRDLGPISEFALIAGDGALVREFVEFARMTDPGQVHSRMYMAQANFASFLGDVSSHFDLCIIDSPPAADIRISISMMEGDAVLSPIQLSQECIEGIAETLSGQRGILRIKASTNPDLQFLGFLPNMVESTAKQREALREIADGVGEFLLRNENEELVFLPRRAAFADAQEKGTALANLAKSNTAAREAWAITRPIFTLILERLGLTPKLRQLDASRRIQKIESQPFTVDPDDVLGAAVDAEATVAETAAVRS